MDSPLCLTGLTLGELTSLLNSRSRALATLKWLYASKQWAREYPASMEGVGAQALKTLQTRTQLPSLEVLEQHAAADGTTKYRVQLAHGSVVETVRIPSSGRSNGRSTICISSQSGCSRKCAFCATATLGFERQLSAGEMVGQYLLARLQAPSDAPARNVVFMGMGEPMDNLDEVLKACEILTQSPAPQLSAEQITVSTSGVLPGMKRFLKEGRASLALSLNATTDECRARLMPQTRQWPIASLIGALQEDKALHPRRVHFIEYVLFDGVNDSDEDALRLSALLEGLEARVNLIPHNAFPGNALAPSPHERVLAFQRMVAQAKIRCLVRWPKGRDIAAACGQLARRAVA